MNNQAVNYSNSPRIAYSIDDVIRLAGLSRQTVYNEINRGRLKTFTVGRRRLISPHALNDWMALLEQDAPPPSETGYHPKKKPQGSQ